MNNLKSKLFLVLFFLFLMSFLNAAQACEHFVLVHGAWHGAWCWFELKSELEANGHTVTIIELPGHGIEQTDPLYIGLTEYQDAVTDVLDTVPAPVILVGHSMGGVAVSLAAEARPWKVKKLVYLAAFMLSDGQSLQDIALQDTQSLVLPELVADPVEGTIDIQRNNISAMFYGLSRNQYISLARTLLRPNPIAPFVTPVILSANYESIDRFYIHTTEDRAISYSIQQQMVAAQPCVATFTMNSDHSPFFSMPKDLGKILDDIAQEKY